MAKSISMNTKKEGHHHATAMEPSSSSTKDIKDERYSLNDKHGASSFRNIGFCRWGKDWLPIIQLGPMDVEPGSVRDMWYDMHHSVSYLYFVHIMCSCLYLQSQLHILPSHYVFILLQPHTFISCAYIIAE